LADDITKTQHIKNVVAMLSDYVKVAETDVKTFGEVMTPISLVNEMLDKLGEDVWMNPNLKWLDPCSGVGIFPVVIIERLMFGLQEVITDEELRYKHIVENMIYMGELQPRNSFVCTHAFDLRNEYALNVYTGSFLSEEFDFHMKEIWGVDKFDIIVQNPPYNKMVDLTFLQKSYSISDKVLFVHPSTWLLDEKGKQKKYTSTKEMIKEHLDSIEFFNGNGVFGISLFVPCVITYLNKHKTSKGIHCIDRINGVELTYDNINSINKFSNTDVYFD
jgi:type I restriction-modification system DNA methylase subunit